MSQTGGCLLRFPFLEMVNHPQTLYLSHPVMQSHPLILWLESSLPVSLDFTFIPILICVQNPSNLFLMTEPEFKSFSWSSSNITVLYFETFPGHILFQFVPSVSPVFPLLPLPLLLSARSTSDKWQSHTPDHWARIHGLLFWVKPASL